MKILMFGWEFPPFNTGGLGTHCYGLTKALHGKDVDVTFVMPRFGKDFKHGFIKIIHAEEGKFVEIKSSLTPYIPSYDVKFISRNGDTDEPYGRDFLSDVNKYTELAARAVAREDCSVIHCHDWMTFPVGIKVKHEKKKPLVVTVHSTEFDRSPLSPNPWISHIEWKGMYEADRIITVSNYMKKRIMDKYNVPGGKITVIYNSVEADLYGGDRVDFGLDERVVLFLGRLTIQKGADYLLRAAKKVLEVEKDVRFIFVGTGHMLPELINLSIDLGISEHVIFTGYQESIAEYYRMADVYVMPSVSEPFGIVALEAMASGLPVIISKQSGCSEIMRHAMKVDFWDVDSMADKVLGVLSYGAMREEMSRNGLKEIKGINWGKTAEQTIGVYSSFGGA
ncbi:MAG: glycosyltransferase family 4 protein [Candidatus Aenigmarchaeota archaeon]|nr:glycosyltransferase family 4 protein [Candidatus Aenigmarchaeota archaeon]